MILNELKKIKLSCFAMNLLDDLPKVGEKYNCELAKVSKMTVRDNFNLPKVRKMTYITCIKLIIVTSDLIFS